MKGRGSASSASSKTARTILWRARMSRTRASSKAAVLMAKAFSAQPSPVASRVHSSITSRVSRLRESKSWDIRVTPPVTGWRAAVAVPTSVTQRRHLSHGTVGGLLSMTFDTVVCRSSLFPDISFAGARLGALGSANGRYHIGFSDRPAWYGRVDLCL